MVALDLWRTTSIVPSTRGFGACASGDAAVKTPFACAKHRSLARRMPFANLAGGGGKVVE